MKKALVLLLVALCTIANAQDDKLIKGYAGGMMIHSGYLKGCDNPYDYNTAGVTLGIGGVLKVNLSKHFRTGFEGYVSTMRLGNDVAKGSFNKIFWTGLLGDWTWKWGRFYPYVGATVGGGVETSYYMFDGSADDWQPEERAVFHKEPLFVVDPFAGVEYALTASLRFTLKMDYLLAFNASQFNKPYGPRVYFGVIFAH